ncbi:MAG: hypothetical protein QY332_15955 [Anaerolineales bacterium]|nr:hypothetical protein [Anaerolineales bacterium]WKZ35109.1 MAG: hypothetical protein QY332_15955 [Anaerolineales bacterium]
MNINHEIQINYSTSTSEDNFSDLNLLFDLANKTTSTSTISINMERAGFITPSRALGLILVCRHIYGITKKKVLLRNVSREVQKYLQRMDIPVGAQDWLEIENLGADEWARNSHTSQLLEMTRISTNSDVEKTIERAENIFSHWLNKSALNSLLGSLSELCSNVYQHSADKNGIVLIQKYEKQALNVVNVQVAVGDLGCGIRGSLESRYGLIAGSAIDYLKLAMEGQSARDTGRGGLGLRRVEQILQDNNGSLYLRSHDATVLSHFKAGRVFTSETVFFPGTQIALGLNFSLLQS